MVVLSVPPAMTRSWTPEATIRTACRKATVAEAQAPSNRVAGAWLGMPISAAKNGAIFPWASSKGPRTLPMNRASRSLASTLASSRASAAARANISFMVRSDMPNLVIPTPKTTTSLIIISR